MPAKQEHSFPAPVAVEVTGRVPHWTEVGQSHSSFIVLKRRLSGHFFW
jgi:hypothetical protein